jgi:hypothetical protein
MCFIGLLSLLKDSGGILNLLMELGNEKYLNYCEKPIFNIVLLLFFHLSIYSSKKKKTLLTSYAQVVCTFGLVTFVLLGTAVSIYFF